MGSLSPLQGIFLTQETNLVSYIAGRFFTTKLISVSKNCPFLDISTKWKHIYNM